MPYQVVDGSMVRVERTFPGVPEVSVTTEVEVLLCPVCGKSYRTERGLTNHLETHDEEEE